MRGVIDEGRNAVQGLRPALNDLEQALARAAEELRGSQEVEIRMVVALMAWRGIREPAPCRNDRPSIGVEYRSHGGIPIL